SMSPAPLPRTHYPVKRSGVQGNRAPVEQVSRLLERGQQVRCLLHERCPMTPPKRILSGVQPSGKLHLGNYFGAVRQHIALQQEAECFYFIADYHALTTIHDPKVLAENTRDVALDYLALGLDSDKATFFRQSDLPEVTELAWILGTVTNMGLLERAVSYKGKIDKGIDASVGLFTYPMLMAADILICRS